MDTMKHILTNTIIRVGSWIGGLLLILFGLDSLGRPRSNWLGWVAILAGIVLIVFARDLGKILRIGTFNSPRRRRR